MATVPNSNRARPTGSYSARDIEVLEGLEWSQRFKRGKPTTEVKKVRPFRGHGTTIFFRPDDEIFRRVQFISETIRQHLEDISYIHGGLKISFVDETRNERIEFVHP